jgi:hypothetical protein
VFEAIISFQKFKKIFNFIIFFSFLYQISHRNLACLWEKFSDKFFNLFIDNFVGNAEHFEAGANWAVNEKLELDQLQPLHLVEIENIE